MSSPPPDPSGSDPIDAPPAQASDSGSSTGPRTMPPPELFDRSAPASVGQLVLEASRTGAPLSRRTGARAEQWHLAARIAAAVDSQDADDEREASIALARLLAQRGLDLDLAVRCARRALEIGDDRALRGELAGWLAGLGDPSLAALTLRPLGEPSAGPTRASTLVRIAVLLARADDPGGAADALREAAEAEPRDAIACELLGTLAAWAPAEVPAQAAAAAYLEAAQRREAAKEKEAAFEDRLRAFEVAPHDEAAAAAVAEALVAKSRGAAADEVLRFHAAALCAVDAARGRDVQRRRMLAALKDGDPARAVGALLDASVEGRVDVDTDARVEEALTHAGLYELLAARLELRAERKKGWARAEAYKELARLYGGPLASPERALEAWIEAAASDAGSSARDALRDHLGARSDALPLAEALVRLALSPHDGPAVSARLEVLRELATLAEERLSSPLLASWAWTKSTTLGEGAAAQAALERVRATALAHEAELDELLANLEGDDERDGAAGPAREARLRRAAELAAGRPDEPATQARILEALLALVPNDRPAGLALERLAWRVARGPLGSRGEGADGSTEAGPAAVLDALERVLRKRVAAGPSRVELVAARLALGQIARRRGDEGLALVEVQPLLAEAPGHRGGASAALLLAARAGDGRARAEALVEIAAPAWPGLRAVLLAVAAELMAAAGLRADARRLAEQATEADPTSARAVATLAAVTSPSDGRAGASALERAMGVVVPRGALCDALAAALEGLGELGLALAWTQRWLALAPGSPRAIGELIRRSTAARDGSRLADALSWVLAQPEPLRDLASPLADALDVLFELDSARALGIARRALDVFGPRVRVLQERLLALADRAGDTPLGISVLERTVASDPTRSASDVLLDLSERRARAGDFDGAAHELCRASEHGADADVLLDRVVALESELRVIGGSLGSDGLVSLAEARAAARTALTPLPEPESAKRRRGDEPPLASGSLALCANALRELGGLRWDLVGDKRGAEAAFFAAVPLSAAGVGRYARDVCEFAGIDDGLDVLTARADAVGAAGDDRLRANLLIEVADIACAEKQPERALAAAVAAIAIDPSRADAVALVERSAHVEGGIDALDDAYTRLAQAALGCYGRRAAHYRAARQLERRGAGEQALRHAVASFEAVPSEGSSFVLMARLAERTGDGAEAVRAIERVAQTGAPELRSAWLTRAAALAGNTPEGRATRFDVLLRALHVRPDVAIVRGLDKALVELADSDIALAPERLARALRAVLTRLDGPEGARTAIVVAKVAAERLGDAGLALAAVDRAMAADGDIDEYVDLGADVPVLSSAPADRDALLAKIAANADKPYASVGPALLSFASRLARAAGDARGAAALLVQAARRAPDDDTLVHEADIAVRELGDETLSKALDDALPVARRLEALVHLADRYEGEGADDKAIVALQRVLASADLADEERAQLVVRLRHRLGVAGRADEAERLLEAELERDLDVEHRKKLARDVAGQRIARGDHEGALAVLSDAARKVPLDRDLLVEVQRLARRTGDRPRQLEVLRALSESSGDEPSRILALRELLPLYRSEGDRSALVATAEAILQLVPGDTDALEALEQDAAERGDHEGIAVLLSRRIEAAAAPELRRTLRLRRAAVLEQRLGRLDEACVELERLLGEVDDDASALRFLADIHERLGAPLRAAPLWGRLGELATTTDEKGEYGLRACASYLAGGDVATARRILDAVASLAPREQVVQLRVELARAEGDARALSDALDQLASASHEPADRRAEILLEAARAASAIGDDSAALDRARRASKLAPSSPEAVLEARRLEYKARGPGDPREAQEVAAELSSLGERLTPSQFELHAFLLAEELDVIQGGGAGMRELSRRHAEIGPRPLVALGMAERLSRIKSFDAALPLYEQALAGDLAGLRSRGRVALAAAEAAVHAGQLDVAKRLLEEAAAEPETRRMALRRQLELTAARAEPAVARLALEELVRQSTGIDKGRALLQLARQVAVIDENDPSEALALLAEAKPLVAADRSLRTQVDAELARLAPSEVPVPLSARETPTSRPSAPRTSGAAPPVADLTIPQLPMGALEFDEAAPSTPSPPPMPAIPPPPEDGRSSSPSGEYAVVHDDELRERPSEPEYTPTPILATRVSMAEPPPVAPEPEPQAPPPSPRAADEPPASPQVGRAAITPAPPPASPRAPTPTPSSPGFAAVAPPARISDPGPVQSSVPPHSTSDPSSLRARLPIASLPPDSDSVPPSTVMATTDEALLFRELCAGSFDAGEQLIAILGDADGRSHDVLAVRRQQAWLRPGDRTSLDRLHHAAVADHNQVYARAIEHVLRAFDPGAGPLPPPPLMAQHEASPQLVASLLFRGTAAPVNEALAIVWEAGIYRRDATAYKLTGLERVQAGPASVIGAAYGGIARILGMGRTTLFQPRSPGPPAAQVALLYPPAVLLTGDVREETPELRYLLGSSLAGAMAEHVLVNGLPEETVRTLLDTLVAAFGPFDTRPREPHRRTPSIAKLEQDLWQLIPPRGARRLGELCRDPTQLTWDVAVACTRRAMRRAGLFASGSIGAAVRILVNELALPLAIPLEEPDGLAQACADFPEVADLVRLATRAEYAEARWQPGSPSDLRRPDSGSRYRAGS